MLGRHALLLLVRLICRAVLSVTGSERKEEEFSQAREREVSVLLGCTMARSEYRVRLAERSFVVWQACCWIVKEMVKRAVMMRWSRLSLRFGSASMMLMRSMDRSFEEKGEVAVEGWRSGAGPVELGVAEGDERAPSDRDDRRRGSCAN
jgi:hypothetical protein